MKKILFLLIFSFSIFINFATADLWWFTIKDYDVNITINQSGDLHIDEYLTVNFTELRHWIYRDIPFLKPWRIYISDVKVPEQKIEITNENNWIKRIRIWHPRKEIIWIQKYQISYDVFGWIRKFTGYQELYRNIIWTERNVSISDINFTITLPKEHHFNTWDIFLYYWYAWAKNTEATKIVFTSNKITGKLNTHLKPHQGLTIWLKFPNNFFQLDEKKLLKLQKNEILRTDALFWLLMEKKFKEFWWSFITAYSQSMSYLVPLLSMIILVFFFGLPKKVENHIFTQYEAPKWISPSEAWMLIDDKIHPRDIICIIYDRTNKGYIKIETKEEKFLLKKYTTFTLIPKKTLPKNTKKYEKVLFEKFFGRPCCFHEYVLWNDKWSFIEDYGIVKNILYNYILQRKRYKKTPKQVFRIFSLWFYWTVVITSILSNSERFTLGLNTIIMFFVWYKYFKFITRKTKEGKKLHEHLMWYKDFIKHVEEPMLKAFLKQDPNYIDKLLPYAVVFGLDTAFLKKAESILTTKQNTNNYISKNNFPRSTFNKEFTKSFKTSITAENSWWWFGSGWWSSWWGGGGWWWGSR